MRRLVSSCFALCFVFSCSKTEREYAGGEAGSGGAGVAGASGSSASGAAGVGASAGGTAGVASAGGTSGSGGAAGAPGDGCGAGTKACGGTCVPVTDPLYGCGADTCDDSGCPNPGFGGMLVCDGASCKIGACGAGFKLCDDTCVAVSDPTYGCGATSCDDSECPDPGTETLVCEGTACVIGACGADTKKCEDKCVPTDRNNGCADTASCTPCTSDEECLGEPSACTCVPVDETTACSDKECGTVSNGCGDDYTCGTCAALPNAVATCQSNTCVNSCAAGIMPLTCPNIAPDMPRCGAWSFETNTVEGWIKGDPSDAAITGKTTIAVSTAQKFDGSRALMVTTTIPGGENPSTFDYEQMITFETPLCPDASSLNLTNRVLEVHAYFERISGTALNSGNATITAGSVQQTSGGDGGVGSSPFNVAEGTWLSGTSQVSVAATHLTISVKVIPRLATPWNGRIYFDVIALH